MMKKILIIMLLIFTLTATQVNAGWREINTEVEKSNIDTPIHYTIGAVGTALLYHYLPDDIGIWKHVIALSVPTLIGTCKELTDKHFDGNDIKDYSIGSIIGGFVINIKF